MNLDKRYAKTQRAQAFLESDAGQAVYDELLKMIDDDTFNTVSTFSPAAENGTLQFVDKHMNYLCSHLDVNADQYLSNLRLITKKRDK